MNDCLVKTLKESVNNELLPRENELLFYISSTTGYCIVQNSKAFTMTIVGNGKMSTVSNADAASNGITSLSLSANSETNVYFTDGEFYLRISDKYTIKRIYFREGIYVNNLKKNDVAYIGGLERVYMRSGVDTDINIFSENTNLTYLQLYSNFIGNFNSLGKLTKLTSLTFSQTATPIGGKLEDFVNDQVNASNNPRTTCNNFSATALLRFVSFYGYVDGHNTPNIITWNGTSKIVAYVGNGGVASSPIVIAYGVTAEEISAWQQAGRTVTVVSSNSEPVVYPPTNG